MNDQLRTRIAACVTPLHGWMEIDKAVRLAELILEAGAELSVELGVFGGRGVVAMALGHEAIQRGVVVGVDAWEVAAALEGVNDPANDEWWSRVDYDAIYESFVEAVVRYGLIRRCRIMRERSDTAVRLFADESIAILHQDSNHSEKISTAEVGLWTPKLRHGGYWIADDSNWPTVQPALQLLAERGFELVAEYPTWRIYRKS